MENWGAIAAIPSFLLSRNRIRRFIISNVLSRIDTRASVSLMKHREIAFYDRGRLQLRIETLHRRPSNLEPGQRIIHEAKNHNRGSRQRIKIDRIPFERYRGKSKISRIFLFYLARIIIIGWPPLRKKIYYIIRIDGYNSVQLWSWSRVAWRVCLYFDGYFLIKKLGRGSKGEKIIDRRYTRLTRSIKKF